MRNHTRILVVGNGTLFDEGLFQLLAQKTRFQVTKMMYTNDTEFLAHFRVTRPEVVVLFEGGLLNAGRLFQLVDDMSQLNNLQVFRVMAEGGAVEMYERHDLAAVCSDQLVSLIQNGESTYAGISGRKGYDG